jgi:hypothetical protein
MSRSCIECWHWHFYGGSPDESDVTFGEDGFTGCMAKQWPAGYSYQSQAAWPYVNLHHMTRDEFIKRIAQAETCQKFADRALPEPPNA